MDTNYAKGLLESVNIDSENYYEVKKHEPVMPASHILLKSEILAKRINFDDEEDEELETKKQRNSVLSLFKNAVNALELLENKIKGADSRVIQELPQVEVTKYISDINSKANSIKSLISPTIKNLESSLQKDSVLGKFKIIDILLIFFF